MKHTVLKNLSYLGLALTLLPCFFFFAGVIGIDAAKGIMIAGMFLWFGTAVFWIKPSSFDEN